MNQTIDRSTNNDDGASELEQTLKRRFTLFGEILDLGFFSWTPGPKKPLFQVTANDIRRGIRVQDVPDVVIPIEVLEKACPLKFVSLKGTQTKVSSSEYPYNPSYLAPTVVAMMDRNVNEIDFVLGGSTLNLLATQKIANKTQYWVQKIPGTQAIVVQRQATYFENFADVGYQVERFVCGVELGSIPEQFSKKVYHLQTMRFDGHHLLICAESDAMDDRGRPVEITCRGVSQWGIKVALQMISNGSVTLYAGTKSKDDKVLVGIHRLQFELVLAKALQDRSSRQIESNIQAGLRTISEASRTGLLDDGHIFSVSFENRELQLNRLSKLPPESTIRDLLSRPWSYEEIL